MLWLVEPLSRVARSLIFLATAFIGLSSLVVAKSTDDIVILKNGDHLTGEIKALEHGELTFKCAYIVDPMNLDWAQVARLESKDHYIVLLTNGNVFTARIQLNSTAPASQASFSIRTDATSFNVKPTDVVELRPADHGFWKQLNGTIDYGFSYTSGNSQYQTQLDASANYNGEGYEVTGDLSSTFSDQAEGNGSSRNAFNSQYRKLFKQKWFYGGIVDLLNSEDQSLDLRVSLGGFVGRRFIQTNRTSLSVFAGAAGSHERYASTDGSLIVTSADSLLGLNFSTFRFKTLSMNSRLLVWPSLTDSGRVRIGLDSNFRVQLVKDLYWSVNLYDNFDNKPPVNAKRNELGISTSFGWKY